MADDRATTTPNRPTRRNCRAWVRADRKPVSASAAPTAAAPTGTTQEGTIASSSSPLQHHRFRRWQCARAVNGFGADSGSRDGSTTSSAQPSSTQAAHAVAANGESASARRYGRHDRSLECGVAAVLACTTTLTLRQREHRRVHQLPDARHLHVICAGVGSSS